MISMTMSLKTTAIGDVIVRGHGGFLARWPGMPLTFTNGAVKKCIQATLGRYTRM